MSDLWQRLKQRKLVQWAVAYVAAAFALLQGIDIIAQQFGWPELVQRGITLALLLGFFVVLVLAWYHGERGAQRVSGTELLLLALLLAIGGGFIWRFAAQVAPESVVDATAAQSPDSAPGSAAEADIPTRSIAVLAFLDLSPNHDQDYFSDGVAEELLNALAKVDGLKVAGRTSSFHYKGKNEDIRSIGKALGVANVLEGSVRTQGDKVRITAQLIRTRDGFQLWSDSYDGDLKDVFAVQEKIARKITDRLQVVLSGRQAEQLVDAGTRNPEAYALYLQATATFNRRDGARFDEALAQLRKAVTLDPNFARAYSRMATLEAVRANYAEGDFETSMRNVERYARQASLLDPRLAEPHAALGSALVGQRRYRESRQEMARALALDPNDVTTNFWNGVGLIMMGYRNQGAAALDRVLQIDPLLPNALVWRANIHIADGELDVAERQLQRAAEGGHSFVGLGQYKLDLARGDRAGAIESLTTGLTYFVQGFPPSAAGIFARACLGDASARREAMRLIDDYLATKPKVLSAIVPFVLIRSGEVERGLALAESSPTNNDGLLISGIFSGLEPEVLPTPAFTEFIRKTGLAAYWDEFGPPDLCRKNDAGEYACAAGASAFAQASPAAQ
jgi:TolB-like protein/Tfp pilus assembly protein PilF